MTGCTHKDNPVGYNSLGQPEYIRSENINNVYSYEDSVNNYVNSSIITIGNRENYETRLLLRFSDLPDSSAEFEVEVINLQLVISKQVNSQENTYQAGIINQNWDQNQVTYKSACDTTDWDENSGFGEVLFNYPFSGDFNPNDTLNIPLPLEIFYQVIDEKYQVDSLATNFGIYIKRDNAESGEKDFIEFYSSENDVTIQPKLSFNYKNELEDEEYTSWESVTTYDASIYYSIDAGNTLEYYKVYPGILKLQNISPVKMFLELNIGYEDFTESEGGVIADSSAYHNMTINRALLVLHAKEDHYGSNSYIYTQPSLLTDSTLVNTPADNEIPVYEDDYELISGVVTTQDSLKVIDENLIYKIDVTKEIQAITADNDGIEGFGVIIRSLRENRDFSYVSFYTPLEETDKRPYLEIYYTPPLEP